MIIFESLYLDSVSQFVKSPVQPVLTVSKSVLCHPLICILSALRSHMRDLSWFPKVNLKKLKVIVVT